MCCGRTLACTTCTYTHLAVAQLLYRQNNNSCSAIIVQLRTSMTGRQKDPAWQMDCDPKLRLLRCCRAVFCEHHENAPLLCICSICTFLTISSWNSSPLTCQEAISGFMTPKRAACDPCHRSCLYIWLLSLLARLSHLQCYTSTMQWSSRDCRDVSHLGGNAVLACRSDGQQHSLSTLHHTINPTAAA